MTLARLIRAAKAQNARTVRVWATSRHGLLACGVWRVACQTLLADVGANCVPMKWADFAKASKHYGSDFKDLTFRVQSHRGTLVCLATASTRPLPPLHVPDAADNRHAGRHVQAKVTWSPLCL